MAELIGKDAVKSFIEHSKKKRFKVFGSGDDIKKITARWISEGEDPTGEFETWANMVDSSGLNTTNYKIRLYDVEEVEGEAKPARGTGTAAITITFQLNTPQPRTVGAPTTQPGVLTEERLLAILNGQKPQIDIAAVVSGAVKEVAHQYQIKEMQTSSNSIVQSLTQQLADMREDLAAYMEEEEKDREDSETAKAIEAQNQVEIKKMEMITGLAREHAPMVKDLIYNFIPGMARNHQALNGAGQSMAVNGPGTISAKPQSGFQIPVSDKIGELAAYATFPATGTEEEKTKFYQDQEAKMKTACMALYTEVNGNMGDDLMIVYKMYKDMPTQFEKMIIELRKTMGVPGY